MVTFPFDADTKLPVTAEVKINGAAIQASYDAGIYTVTATATGSFVSASTTFTSNT